MSVLRWQACIFTIFLQLIASLDVKYQVRIFYFDKNKVSLVTLGLYLREKIWNLFLVTISLSPGNPE